MPIKKASAFIVNETYEKLPLEVITMVKKCLLDFIGAAYAGYQCNSSTIAQKSTEWLGGNEVCTIIGSKRQASPLAATFINATLASGLDIDDGHRGAVGHPGCMTIPPLLATAEMLDKCSGKAFIEAIAVGYEIGIRSGIVMNSNHQQLFYGSGGWSLFGAAAAVAKIKQLTGEQLNHALTIGEVYGPTAQCDKSIAAGAMTKESVGWGAVTGLMGVLMAESGFTGPDNILMDTHLYNENVTKVFQDLGQAYEIKNVYFKQFPSCKWSHSPIVAVKMLKDEYNFNVEKIRDITIETFQKALTLNHTSPETTEAAQYSIPFTVATALYYGDLEPIHMAEENLKNKKVYNIAQKIRLVEVDDLERKFPAKRPARVKVRMDNGEVYTQEIDLVKGDAEKPFTWNDVTEKFHSNTKRYLEEEHRLKIINEVKNLDNVTDIKEFYNLLKCNNFVSLI